MKGLEGSLLPVGQHTNCPQLQLHLPPCIRCGFATCGLRSGLNTMDLGALRVSPFGKLELQEGAKR